MTHIYLSRIVILVAALAAFGAPNGIASAAEAGIVTVTFDDGSRTHHEIVAPLLQAHGQQAVFFVNSGLVGGGSYMTWNQVSDLYSAGHEIGAHTLNHTELPTVSASKRASEINQDYAHFVAHGITPLSFASPYGAYDNTTLPLIAKKYNAHRAFANQGLNTWPYNKYLLYVRFIMRETSVDQVKGWIDEAVRNEGWLILVFHEITSTVARGDTYSWEKARFESLLGHLKTRGITTKTISEVLSQYSNLVANPSFENGLTGWVTDSPRVATLNTGNNGSYPNPKNSVRMSGSRQAGHVFAQKVLVTFGRVYGLRAFTDSRSIRAGEVGFYMDEYDQSGAWVSGKWLGALADRNVIDRSYVYRPSSAAVKTVAIQMYMSANASGDVYIDNVELFER